MTYDHNGEQHYTRVKGVSNYVPTDATCTMFQLVYPVCRIDNTSYFSETYNDHKL